MAPLRPGNCTLLPPIQRVKVDTLRSQITWGFAPGSHGLSPHIAGLPTAPSASAFMRQLRPRHHPPGRRGPPAACNDEPVRMSTLLGFRPPTWLPPARPRGWSGKHVSGLYGRIQRKKVTRSPSAQLPDTFPRQHSGCSRNRNPTENSTRSHPGRGKRVPRKCP